MGSFLSLSNALGEAGSFAVYAVVNAAAFTFVLCFVPETKGRQIEDIARENAGERSAPSLAYTHADKLQDADGLVRVDGVIQAA